MLLLLKGCWINGKSAVLNYSWILIIYNDVDASFKAESQEHCSEVPRKFNHGIFCLFPGNSEERGASMSRRTAATGPQFPMTREIRTPFPGIVSRRRFPSRPRHRDRDSRRITIRVSRRHRFIALTRPFPPPFPFHGDNDPVQPLRAATRKIRGGCKLAGQQSRKLSTTLQLLYFSWRGISWTTY